jgi:hypothetical protein
MGGSYEPPILVQEKSQVTLRNHPRSSNTPAVIPMNDINVIRFDLSTYSMLVCERYSEGAHAFSRYICQWRSREQRVPSRQRLQQREDLPVALQR